MPRPLRIQFDNAYYHVINRGLDKRDIFLNDKGHQIFLEILAESCETFGVMVHAYCLMSNHYHLLLQTPKGNLSKFMQRINGLYTRRFNKFVGGDGPIFRGRFKSKLVEEERYLLTLSRYIHRNPIDFVKSLADYRWSSYPAYLGLNECPVWLNTNFTMELFNMDKKSYQGFVEVEIS